MREPSSRIDRGAIDVLCNRAHQQNEKRAYTKHAFYCCVYRVDQTRPQKMSCNWNDVGGSRWSYDEILAFRCLQAQTLINRVSLQNITNFIPTYGYSVQQKFKISFSWMSPDTYSN